MAILGGHRDSHDLKQKCGEFCDVNSDQTQSKNSSGEQTEQKKNAKFIILFDDLFAMDFRGFSQGLR